MPETALPSRRKAPFASVLGLAAIILAFGIVRGRVLDLPLERDEGEYAYTSQIMLEGSWPYRDAYSMKLPGIFLVYAGLITAFGQTASAIHLGLLLFVSVSTILVFFLARQLVGDASALVAAGAFALLSSSRAATGFTANAEPFILPFVLAGLLLLRSAVERGCSGFRLFLAGLCFGAAVLIKQHGAAFGLFGAVYLLAALLRPRTLAWRAVASRFLAFASGAVLPFAVSCLVFLGAGIFRSFWFYTFVYSRTYVSHGTLSEALEFLFLALGRLIASDPIIWAAGAVGLGVVISRRWEGRPKLFFLGLAAASALAVLPGFYFRPHYFVLAFPSIALGAGAAFRQALGPVETSPRRSPRRLIVTALVLVAFGGQVYLQRGMLFAASPEEASWQMYGVESLAMIEARAVAASLGPRLKPTDTVAVMGSEPQVYFYLRKRAPTSYLYFYYLTEDQVYAQAMREEFESDMEKSMPDYLIYAASWHFEFSAKEAYKALTRWYEDFRDRNYTLIGMPARVSLRGATFRWDKGILTAKTHLPLGFLVYRRNGRAE